MRGITKSFGRHRALDGVDLTVRAGEIHGLLGENGAGKSTLMGVLAGSIRPDSGIILVDGRRLRPGSPPAAAALGVGLVHQHFSLVPALTVAENLALAGGSPALYRRNRDLGARGLQTAERLGWRFEPGLPVYQLPVGRQQRLEIVKVLQRDARWLLLDEPTAVLSPPESDELFEVLERLRAEGRGIVFISHKLPEVLRLCDRVTVLRLGRQVGERDRGVTATELARLMMGPAAQRDAPDSESRCAASRLPSTTRGGGTRTPASPGDAVPQKRENPREHAAGGETAGSAVHRPALEVRDLRVLDHRGLEAVRGVSFDLAPGEILGIAGVDGNGQIELAEAIMGLRSRLAGSVSIAPAVGARKASHAPLRPGYIPEDRRRAGLVLPMSVRENLVLEIHEAPRFRWGPVLRLDRLWAAARGMARQFDIRVSDLRQAAATLSGGNQQKIVVARALAGERTLLVAVNPTRGLDLGATRFVHEQLRTVSHAGLGVLLISTDLDEVLELSDRIGVLYEGRLQGIVPPTESRERLGQMMGGVGGGTTGSA